MTGNQWHLIFFPLTFLMGKDAKIVCQLKLEEALFLILAVMEPEGSESRGGKLLS